MPKTFLVNSQGLDVDQNLQDNARPFDKISGLIGLVDGPTICKLKLTIEDVLENRQHRLVIWRLEQSIIGMLISLRPAREPGFAVLSLTDLDEPLGNLRPDDLIELFKITRAEAEIAVAIYCGMANSTIASVRGAQPETVRGQIKTLLHKMGVANQKQLTLLLCRIGLALPERREYNPFGGLRLDFSHIDRNSEN